MSEGLILELAVVMIGAAILAVAADFARQPIIIAYVLAGVLFGPHSPWPLLRLVQHIDFIRNAGAMGLMLLLFLLGMVLHPDRLLKMFRQASFTTLSTSLAFFGIGFVVVAGASAAAPAVYPLTPLEAVYVGFAVALSSTLLVVKLLPTRRLHESAVGTLVIGILIVQDALAILVLLVMAFTAAARGGDTGVYWKVPLGLAMLAAAFPVEQYGLRRLMRKVETYPELLLVLSLAWCLLMAEGARNLGFSREIGALVAGLAIARSPISLYIWEKVAPLRDFFIVLLFFSLGALVNVADTLAVLPLAAVLALVLALVKPRLFVAAMRIEGTPRPLAREAGWRLGQSSEFAFVIAFLAVQLGHIGQTAFELILVTTLLSFILSTYLVVLKYHTPLGVSEGLRQA
jgi:Kef-type K+ transport system membrane component KefB